ncbi:hypothetical protein TNCV_3558501 [Trichonephila clavipes]|uniref:Uncharacterized protein n=1 Tax=Trichonephila clavipes TaxID=2585209 RepID=A0A8X7BJ51_TRICX|nr:hypothetical protein TNCV_3558501 [Trichonephila clavipes]
MRQGYSFVQTREMSNSPSQMIPDMLDWREIWRSFLCEQHHSKWRHRWVDMKGSTRNGRHDPKCPSARHLRMVREDTGAPVEVDNLCLDESQWISWLYACISYDVAVFTTTGLLSLVFV